MKDVIANFDDFELDSDTKKSLMNLSRESASKKISIVTGAGISVSSGLPTWHQLLEKTTKIFLVHWDLLASKNMVYSERVPAQLSIAMAENIFLDNVDAELVKFLLKDDPLMLAQLIKNCVEENNWNWMLRKCLYDDYTNIKIYSATFESIFNLIVTHKNKIDNILTYNYDNFLELYLRGKGIKTQTIIKENSDNPIRKLPIYYLHGILPVYGGIKGKVYLTEDDYLSDIVEPNSWYNQLHASTLTNNICIFLGLSFNDPSLKRKLSVNRLHRNHYHYAILCLHDDLYSKRKFLLLKNELLRLNVRVITYPYTDRHTYLPKIVELIKNLC
ncbi:MAG TPA: SIR2 family protein [Sphingobacteriaceae bacterium]|nr:SIR2 family protein [Sphingobacteriaceae bacterium]